MTVDHAIPKSRGGSNFQDNFRLACRACNSRKANLTEEEFFSVLAYLYDPGDLELKEKVLEILLVNLWNRGDEGQFKIDTH